MESYASVVGIVGVVFFATLIRSAVGFGEALIAVPLLALLIPVEVAAPLAVLVSITVAGVVVVQDWNKVEVRSAAWLILSTLFGIPFGVMLLKLVAEPVVKTILAVIIITFSSYCLSSRRTLDLKNDRLANSVRPNCCSWRRSWQGNWTESLRMGGKPHTLLPIRDWQLPKLQVAWWYEETLRSARPFSAHRERGLLRKRFFEVIQMSH